MFLLSFVVNFSQLLMLIISYHRNTIGLDMIQYRCILTYIIKLSTQHGKHVSRHLRGK